MDKAISIIVPTYNESKNIVALVEQLHQACNGYSYETLIVDDNSPDGTAGLAASLAPKYPVRVIVRKGEKGLASAVVHGFRNTQADIIGVIDADLQHPPKVVPALIEEVKKGAEVVVASRYIPGGGCEGWGLVRRIMSKGAIFLAHLLLPTTRKVSDPMSGFFMINRSVLNGAYLNPTGFKILLEIIMEGRYSRVSEVPYMFRTRTAGASKLNARQQIDYLKHLYSLMRRKGELTRFLKFCLVGASGVLVNYLVFALFKNIILLGIANETARNVTATAFSAEASILSNFVLNDVLTFRDRRQGSTFGARLVKFNLVSLIGIGIQTGCMALFNGLIGINEYIALTIGIAIATLWNYFANSRWTWK